MSRTSLRSPLLAALLASTALVGAGSALAQSLPTGGRVVSGGVTIGTPTNGGLAITQSSQNAIVNWQGFSIGQGNRVDIVQPNSQAAILNRVTGNTRSTIAGQLNANGQVYLVNPNGISITPTGTVNAAGFVASTLDTTDEDFRAGRRQFRGSGASARVTNAGTITIGRGGYAALIGGQVSNSGTISVPLGRVALGSGERATLDLSGDGFLQVAVPTNGKGRGALVQHSGTISADGGTVQLSAAAARDMARQAVNLSGTIEARAVSGRNGSITLSGGEGAVVVSGRLDVSGHAGRGGSITMTGRNLALMGARLDASGKTGGGTVRIGGGREGLGLLARAETVTVDAATRIAADATQAGNGGDVVVWSDVRTHFAGTISAKGGADGGNGGEAEVSSKGVLAYDGTTILTAVKGAFGTLLLDPYNITISTGTNTGGFTASADDSVINATTLQNGLATANVTVSTGSSGSQAGNITVAAPVTWSANSLLTLTAAGSIAVDAPIRVTGGGKVALNFSTADAVTGGLAFAAGGAITYADGQTGQALSVNGSAYTLLRSMSQVAAINTTGLSGRYALAHDLDATGTTYANAVIGSGTYSSGYFSGTLEGLGHSIANLTIASTGDYVGLVGALSGTVRDIGIVGGSISGAESTGGLIGYISGGTLRNAYATGAVTGTQNVGGLIGTNAQGTATNVYATGAVNGSENDVGGLVGYTDQGIVTNAYATGAVSSAQYYVGGLVGYGNGGTVSNAYATGAVSGSQSYVGGLMGANSGTVTNAYATGTVSGDFDVGGLIGINNTGAVSNAYATGAVSGNYYVGGLIAYDSSGLVSNAYATGAVSGLQAIGGLIGFADSSTVSNVYATGAVNSQDAAGGLIGYNYQGSVTKAYATGAVSGQSDVGGVVGFNDGGSVSNSHWDTTTSGLATDGTNASGATGLTTAQFQSGGASALGSAFAGGTNGLYPYLASFFPNGVQAISGIAVGSVSTGIPVATAQIGVYQGGGLLGGGTVSTGANGYFYTIVPTGTLTATSAVGTTMTLAGATAPSAFNYADAQTLDANGNLSGLLVANGLRSIMTAAPSWSTLTSALATTFGTARYAGLDTALAATSALVFATNTTGFSIDTALSLGTGDLTLAASGALTLANTVSANTIMLAAADSFTNTAGANALTAGNRWLVYSLDPARDTRGGLAPDFIQYNSDVATAPTTGNGLLYNLAPVLTVGLTGTVAKTYDGTAAATLAAGNFTMSGVVSGDSVVTTAASSYDTANAGTAKTVSASSLAITSASNGSIAVYGYQLASTTASGAIGTITPATLTYDASAATRVYGDANPTPSGTLTGFVGGETQASATLGTLAFAPAAGVTSNVGSHAIDGSGLSANNGNYVFVQAAGNATSLTVTARPITLTADARSRVYGEANPGLTYAVGGLGLVNGDSLTGGLATTATTASDVGSYTIGQGSLAASANYAVSYAGANLTVGQRGLTLTADAQSRVYGEANPGLTYAVGGLGLVNGDSLTGGLATTATTASDVGSYTIGQGSLAASANYAVSYAGANLTVGQRGLTLTADAQSRVYGEANPGLTYAVGGLGLVNGDSLTGGLATTATTASDVGSYTIGQGSLAASANYAVSYAGANLTVGQRGLTLTADAQSRVYGEANPGLTYTVDGLGLVNGDSLTGGLATTATTASDVGSYTIGQGSLAASANYAVSYAGANLTVGQRGLTLTADAQSRVYGEANPGLTYTVGGLGLVNGDSLTGGLATTATTASDVGSYTIGQGSLAASANYAVSYAGANLTVGQRGLTLTADAQSRVYGEANPGLTYAVGGLGLVNGDSLTGGLATTATTASDVGSYTIGQGSLAASANYAVSYAGANLTVGQRGLTLTADAQSRVYGEANPGLTYAVGGLGLVNGDSLTGGLATTATTASDVGSYTIGQGSLAASANYAVSYAGANLTVGQRGLTLTADAQSRVYGEANPGLTYAVGGLGLVNGDSLTGGLATTATTASDVGSYTIGQGSLAASANYAVSYAGANLTVGQRGLTLTADAQSRVYGEANPALSYTVGGLGLVNGDSLTGGLATTATTASDVGSYTIGQGSLAASANYAVSYAGANLTVGQRGLTLTADAQSRVYGEANPGLTYTVDGLGLVNGDSLTGGLATTATTASDVGSYTIGQGSLAASANYAVSYAGANLTVGQRGLTLTADAQSRVYGEANPGLTYAVGGLGLVNGDSLTGGLATTATTASDVGSYTIGQGSLAASANYAVSYAGANLTVGQRGLTLTADAQSRVYGEANPGLTYAVGGLGLVNGDSLTGGLATTATTGSDVGSYTIGQGSLAASANYAVSYAGANLTVGQRGLTLTADAQSRVYGEANPALTYTVDGLGLVNGDSLTGGLATTATTASDVGSYTIGQGSLAASANYAVSYAGANLTVRQRAINPSAIAPSTLASTIENTLHLNAATTSRDIPFVSVTGQSPAPISTIFADPRAGGTVVCTTATACIVVPEAARPGQPQPQPE